MALYEPFTEEELTPILDDFYKNGATVIRNVLLREECQKICKRVDQIFAEPYFAEMRNVKVNQPRNENDKAPIVVHRLFECDRMFRDLLVREPIISIAEAVLGPQCHCTVSYTHLTLPTTPYV